MGAEHVGAFIIRLNKQRLRFIGTIDKNKKVEFFPKPIISFSKPPLYTLDSCTEVQETQLQPQEQ